MDWIRILLSRSSALIHRRRMDADLDEELRAHIDLCTAENLRKGMWPEEARLAALRAFGGVTQVRESYRVQRGMPWAEEMGRDIRFAFRGLVKSPGFALTAILTLALGIGAVTSVFSVVNAVLLKPFSFRDPDRLVVMREAVDDGTGRTANPVNYRHFLHLKSASTTIEDAAIFAQAGSSVSADGKYPRIAGAVGASPNIFRLLGVQPILGRDFVDADARKGANAVALLSYAGWQSLLAGDENAVGRTLQVDGKAVTVVGVLPRWMRFPRIGLAPKIAFQETAPDAMIFEPLVPSDRDLHADMGNFNYKTIARLKSGVTLKQASAELESLQNAYTISAHLPLHFGIALTPLTADVASGVSGALWLLFAAVGAVLLIACVNLANLQLARAANAEKETAVRAALGASRAQLVWARLVESLLLAVVGGAAGAALAFAGVRLLIAFVPPAVPRLEEVRVSTPVLLFAGGISILAAIAFGILPALRSIRVDPQSALQGNSIRTVNTREGNRTRGAMVAAQVAVTVVLLIVTSLALRSFSRLMHQNRGFDASHLTLAQVNLFTAQYDADESKTQSLRLQFADRALAALGQLPGIQSVALTSVAPLTGETWVDTLSRPDHPVPAGKEPRINVRWIDPAYLPTMRTSLVAGRNLSVADRANPYVALISERTAHESFLGENPIGHRIGDLVPDDKHLLTIVGVVADSRVNGLKDDAAMVYLPYWAFTPLTLSFLVRSEQPSSALIPEMRQAIWKIDPEVAIPTLKSMDDMVDDSAATDRFQALVLTSFGAAALMLALLGIYGVLAYSVALRRREFGVRIALGSDKAALVTLVLRQAAYPVLLGCAAGLIVAVAALHWVRSVFYGTPAMDPLGVGASLALIAITAGLAAVIPARRAASLDPIQALRID